MSCIYFVNSKLRKRFNTAFMDFLSELASLRLQELQVHVAKDNDILRDVFQRVASLWLKLFLRWLVLWKGNNHSSLFLSLFNYM